MKRDGQRCMLYFAHVHTGSECQFESQEPVAPKGKTEAEEALELLQAIDIRSLASANKDRAVDLILEAIDVLTRAGKTEDKTRFHLMAPTSK